MFPYSKVVTDNEGWVDAEVFLPLDYDLVIAKLEDKTVKAAWHYQNTWDGLRLKTGSKITHWKRRKDE